LGIPDPGSGITKRHPLGAALVHQQQRDNASNCVIRFITEAMRPVRYVKEPRLRTLRQDALLGATRVSGDPHRAGSRLAISGGPVPPDSGRSPCRGTDCRHNRRARHDQGAPQRCCGRCLATASSFMPGSRRRARPPAHLLVLLTRQ
jgi:hypothetical protein